jgi:NAD(P)-dependent dehydrogenase (short-subunit alcohol dehydrogenase family)
MMQKTITTRTIPLGFFAQPSDIDGAIFYLASNQASRYVTGSIITIDGGISWGGK